MMIRAARIEDADGIAAVHVRSWQMAYVGLVPQDYLDTLSVDQRRAAWERILAETAGPRSGTLVAEDDDIVIGFVHLCPTRDADHDSHTVGEIASIYVLAEAWGTGTGRALMAAALDRLTHAGFARATLWVLDTNHRARRFYETGPWQLDGATKRDDLRGFPLSEVRYACRLPVEDACTRTLVSPSFKPPSPPDHPRFRFEPLGPEHNAADLDAWSSSIDHIHVTNFQSFDH